ncbi:uncharacterized protein CTRU02_213656 [Colletotrichum truncatum]|uniref:Uncharacterized protein n=1 Tax=Colletotrichum truncatum TaxID=5467 RepID=A0ACC3YGA4_COLTU
MFFQSALFFATSLLSVTVARDLRDIPARQTSPADLPEYDAGLSPVPTADPRRDLRNALLNPRSLPPEVCGYRARDDGSFGTYSCRGINCLTQGSYFGCYTTPPTKCFDGTASQCQPSAASLGPGSRCCTQSDRTYLPFCVTLLKEDNGQKTMFRCGERIHSSRTIMFLGTETTDPDATRTDSTSPSVTPTPTPPDNSPSNTGAIAGGVVGGVAVVAIAVCVIVWLLVRRRRQAKEQAGSAPTPMTPGQQSHFSQPFYGYEGQQQPPGPDAQYPKYYQPVPTSSPQPIYEAPAHNAGRQNAVEMGT